MDFKFYLKLNIAPFGNMSFVCKDFVLAEMIKIRFILQRQIVFQYVIEYNKFLQVGF